MPDDLNIGNRKVEHIDIVLTKQVTYPDLCNNIYNSIILIHQAFPETDYEKIDLSIKFLNYELKAPIIITGITGGHKNTCEINAKLAEIASKYRIALGVGSQRPMLIMKNNEEIIKTYKIVRETATDIPVVGNIGANTLNDIRYEDIEYLVEQIEADALAIHLNPGQELIQPEGDTRFNHTILDKIENILDKLDVPIIIKEVGTGLSMETVEKFYSIGIRYFDTAGACGTNWMLVEMYRNTSELKKKISLLFKNWGIPTLLSLIETRYVAPDSIIIASGGVWDGVRAIKNLVLGSDLVGIALPILRELVKNSFKAEEFLKTYIESMRSTMFLIGARNIYELHKKPVVILDPVKTYLEQRGIDLNLYINYIRSRR